LLKANETAVFDTPAAFATSAMVTRDTKAPWQGPGHSSPLFDRLNRFSKAV
jgi:hypothetical protein